MFVHGTLKNQGQAVGRRTHDRDGGTFTGGPVKRLN